MDASLFKSSFEEKHFYLKCISSPMIISRNYTCFVRGGAVPTFNAMTMIQWERRFSFYFLNTIIEQLVHRRRPSVVQTLSSSFQTAKQLLPFSPWLIFQPTTFVQKYTCHVNFISTIKVWTKKVTPVSTHVCKCDYFITYYHCCFFEFPCVLLRLSNN